MSETKKATESKPVAEKKAVKTTPKAEKKSLEVAVYDITGKELKKINLVKEIYDVAAQPQLVAQYVRVYLANQRQGTASTKSRGEVIGSTKKIYRQKGTGGARHGSRKAPLFVGGGVAFGPKPHDHSLTMNKKQKQKALFSTLSEKARAGAIVALSKDSLEMKPKTKEVASFLKTMKFGSRKVLMVLSEVKENGLVLSLRNIPNVEIVQATNVNPYILLNSRVTIFVEDAFEALENHFLKKHEN